MKTFREVAEHGLPLESFPVEVATFIHRFSESSGAPPSFVAAGVLACACGVADRYSLEVKHKYIERPNLFLAVVGQPGVSKSPPLKAALRPLFTIDAARHKQYEADVKEHKALLKSNPKCKDDPPRHAPCKLLTDGTTEGLIHNLAESASQGNEPHAVYLRDELKGHFESMNQYRKGSDYELWLTLYSGGPVNRVLKSETTYVANACCTVIGGIQPEVYLEHMQDKGDGMVDRFMVAYYDGAPSMTDIFSYVDREVIDDYEAFMLDISESIGVRYKPWDLPRGERGEILELFQEFHRWSYALGEEYDIGAYKKWEQNFYRLVIIMGALWKKEEIDADMITKASDLASFFAIDWIKSRILADAEDDVQLRKKILEILQKSSPRPVKKRDFSRKCRKFRGEKGAIQLSRILAKLVTGGVVTTNEEGGYCVAEKV